MSSSLAVEPVRIGVIGAGRMGHNHCRILSAMRHALLVGITDIDSIVGERVAQQYETTFYHTLPELLSQVDAAVIAAPTPAHFDLAMYCLDLGLHLLIEKPITATIPEAETLVTTAADRGCIVQVGHIERFNPTYTELKHVLEDVNVAAMNFRRLSPYVGSNTDVDVVLDLMIHDLDLVLDLAQEQPVSVHASGVSSFSGDIDHAVAQLNFPTGSLWTVMVSRLTEHKVRSIDVTGLEVYVEGDLLNKSISLHRSMVGEYLSNNHHSVKYRQESVVERIHVPMAEPLLLELQHFVQCIREQREPLVSAMDGLQTLRLANRIRAAIYQNLTLVQPLADSATTATQALEQSHPSRATITNNGHGHSAILPT